MNTWAVSRSGAGSGRAGASAAALRAVEAAPPVWNSRVRRTRPSAGAVSRRSGQRSSEDPGTTPPALVTRSHGCGSSSTAPGGSTVTPTDSPYPSGTDTDSAADTMSADRTGPGSSLATGWPALTSVASTSRSVGASSSRKP